MDGLLGNLFGIEEEDPLLRLLPPEQRQLLMNQARGQGMTNLGLALLQAGGPSRTPTGIGARLGQAGMQAMQANQGVMDRGLERLLTARKMQQEQAQLQRQQEMRQRMAGAITPEGINTQALQEAAMLSDDPLAALTRAAESVPKLRRAGMLPGATQMDNPFALFANSPVQSVRNAAEQLSKSFESGVIDPETADKRVIDLTNLEERAIGRQESLAARQDAQKQMMDFRQQQADMNRQMREQQQGLSRQIAQQNIDLRQEAAAERKAAKEEKAAERAEAKEMKQTSLSNQAKTVLGKVDEALGKVGGFTAGFGGLLANVPGTKARNLQADIDTIKANLGFQQLQAMRDASPTGGALGQVTERELGFLQSTVASLDQLQSPDELRKALNQIKLHYNNWLSAVNKGQAPQQATGVRRYNPATGRVE
jgi:hypothetical protein